MTILPKLIYRISAAPIRGVSWEAYFFVEMYKLTLKFIWNFKGPGIAKATLKKE